MKTLLVLVLALALAGCQISHRKITLPNGVTYESNTKALFSAPVLGPTSWTQTGQYAGELKLGGYTEEQQAALAAIKELAAKIP